MVGTFYRAPEPGASPFVAIGDVVVPGQTLCILEAMKLMNEVKVEQTGIVRAIRESLAQPVEYGQLLLGSSSPTAATPVLPASRAVFTRVLIANRGEIAVRVIRTSTTRGQAVAVYSTADRDALHAARRPGDLHRPADRDRGVSVDPFHHRRCRDDGLRAIHPRYGYSPRTPRSCGVRRDDLVFIGPGAEVMEEMGDKVRASGDDNGWRARRPRDRRRGHGRCRSGCGRRSRLPGAAEGGCGWGEQGNALRRVCDELEEDVPDRIGGGAGGVRRRPRTSRRRSCRRGTWRCRCSQTR